MIDRKSGTRFTFLLLASAAASLPTLAWAQAAQDDNGGGIAEIVVTAEKRESTVEKTPIALNVVDSKTLKTNNVSNLEDLTKILPTVTLAKNGENTFIGIRGVSSRDQNETGSTSVAVSIDGNYFNRSLGLNSAIFDLERVEVLKGPQGTLHGRSATGGAVNFITAKPTKDFSAYAGGGYGAYNELNTEAMINVPLTDWLQARVAFQSMSHDGYWNNAPAKDGDAANSRAGRIVLAFQPADGLTGDLTFEKVLSDGTGSTKYGVPSAGLNHAKPDLPDGKTWPISTPSQDVRVRTSAVRGHLKYDFGGLSLQYTGGYRYLDFNSLLNIDGQVDHVGPFGANAFFGPQHEKIKTNNQEIYLTSIDNNSDTFDFQVGANYFREHINLVNYISFYDQGMTPRYGFIFLYPDVGNEGKAVFGQVIYRPTSNLTLELGSRYNKDKQWRRGESAIPARNVGFSDVDQLAKSKKTTFHAAANWQATPNNLLYAKVDTGYKPGGYSLIDNYGPETVTSYELGSKNRLFGNTLQVNAALFYYDYSDIQVAQTISGLQVITNAGKQRLYGVDADAVFQPTADDRFNVDVLYNHAEFRDSVISGIDVSGNRPPSAPVWSGNAGYEHNFPLLDGKLTLRGQIHFETKSNLGFFRYDSQKQPGFTRSDAFLTYTAPGDKWLVSGYIRNIADKRVLVAALEQSLFTSYVYQFAAPRTYGVRFRMNF